MRTFALTFAACIAFAFPVAAQDIGKVASISPNLTGTPAGGASRRLSQGTAVSQNEVVEASASGRGQLLFRDETTLTIAPNSRVVLDEFVYVPGGGDASFAITLTRGALRMIGGRTTEARDALIVTTAATVGIRGSSAIVFTNGQRTTAIFLMGERMCMARVCTSRRGGVITSDGGYIGRISPQALAQILAQIDGVPPNVLRRFGAENVTGLIGPWTNPRSTNGARIPLSGRDRMVQNWLDQSTIRGFEVIDEQDEDGYDDGDTGEGDEGDGDYCNCEY